VTTETKSVLFNAVPLFAIALAYGGVAGLVVPRLWRERQRVTTFDIALAAMFPCIGSVAAMFGVLVAVRREPLEGHLWLSFAALLVMLFPALFFFVRRPLSGSDRLREAEARTTELDRELASVKTLSAGLVGAATSEEIGRTLIQGATNAVGVDVGAMWLVSDDRNEAAGVLLCIDGRDADCSRVCISTSATSLRAPRARCSNRRRSRSTTRRRRRS